VDADNVTNDAHHREILLSLCVDDHSSELRDYRVCPTLVMKGVINYLDCADESALGSLIRETCVDDHSEEVELILIEGIDIRIDQRCIDILTLYFKSKF
jgi:hypothetical protein